MKVTLVALSLMLSMVACGTETAPPKENAGGTGGGGGSGGSGGAGGSGGTDTSSPECGNGLIEGDESCDPGPSGHPDCTVDCSYVGASARLMEPCSIRGSRSGGLVCIDYGSRGLIWFAGCEVTEDCPTGYDICADKEAGGPVRVCITNGCGPSSSGGPNSNGAYWERCNTETGVLDGGEARGICKPFGSTGVCWRTGPLVEGSACRDLGGLDGKIEACDASSTCFVQTVPRVACDADADCAVLGAGGYCTIDRFCWREGSCVPTCNSGTSAAGPACAGGLACRDDYSMLPYYASQPGTCGKHHQPSEYQACDREGAIQDGFQCLREGGNTGRGIWVKLCETSSECSSPGDVCLNTMTWGESPFCWRNPCGPGTSNGVYWGACNTEVGLLGYGPDDGVCLPATTTAGTYGRCMKPGTLGDGERCSNERSEGGCGAGSLCSQDDIELTGLCDADVNCDADSFCMEFIGVCISKGVCNEICNAGAGTKAGFAACSSPEMSCVATASAQAGEPSLGACR